MREGERAISFRTVGVACASAAVGVGIIYMAAAGAPASYLLMNAIALAIGIVALLIVGGMPKLAPSLTGAAMLGLGGVMLGTALFGVTIEGAARWISFGPLNLQVSLVVLPAMIVGFAGRRDAATTAGIVLAALALALQPDRAMAGVLAASMAGVALIERDRPALIALTAALASFASALVQPDLLPAVPFVDQILYTAFAIAPLLGVLLWFGAALLIVPALHAWRGEPARRGIPIAFGASWLAIVLAAALGNYPTPLVGYSGGAIIGYLLSLAVASKFVVPQPLAAGNPPPTEPRSRGRHLFASA